MACVAVGTTDNTWMQTYAVGTKYYHYLYQWYFPSKPIARLVMKLTFGGAHKGQVWFDDPHINQESTDGMHWRLLIPDVVERGKRISGGMMDRQCAEQETDMYCYFM